MKVYLRYQQQAKFGVIYSPSSNIIYSENKAYCSSLETVCIYDLRTGTLIDKLEEGNSQITCMEMVNKLLACGYADGSIRVWNLENNTNTLFNGHRSPISSLCFDSLGSRLASGSNDTDIVLWDVIAECGIFRFKGHKDQVTCIKFLTINGLNHLVSGSKDSLIKIWDVEAQKCVENIVSHRGEVWALDVSVEDDQITLYTGAADGDVRLWKVEESALKTKFQRSDQDEQPEIKKATTLLGSLSRQSKERILTLKVKNGLIGVQGADRIIEFFKPKNEAEIKKTIARRNKRAKKQNADANQITELEIHDRIPLFATIRCRSKLRSFDFEGQKVLAGLANNALEFYQFETGEKSNECRLLISLDLGGHRSDVRTVALSSDDTLLATGSSDALKIWSLETRNCISTIESGYALCSAFLPGNRHVVIGTKSGHLEVYELASSALLESVEAHQGPIWSLDVKPDKTGLVTGSQDKEIKFWDFRSILDENYSKIVKRLTLIHTRTLKLADDVLCVKISPDGRLLAVALLDLTVKVFYMDTLNFFLSLYGHKLPVISMDISFDSKRIITASSDKTVKIWGLDFGDCHKSLIAHQDSVMACKFVWGTYLFFTASKDKMVKYWDGEKFVLSEEREEQLEKMYDEMELEQDEQFTAGIGTGVDVEEEGVPTGPATKATTESLKAGELLLEALLVWEKESEDFKIFKTMKESGKDIHPPTRDFLVIKYGCENKPPEDFVLKLASQIRSSHLNDALISLPFKQVVSLISCIRLWTLENKDAYLSCKILYFLIKMHHQEIVNTSILQDPLKEIRANLQQQLKQYRDTVGFNNFALAHLRREVNLQQIDFEQGEEEENNKRKKIVVVS